MLFRSLVIENWRAHLSRIHVLKRMDSCHNHSSSLWGAVLLQICVPFLVQFVVLYGCVIPFEGSCWCPNPSSVALASSNRHPHDLLDSSNSVLDCSGQYRQYSLNRQGCMLHPKRYMEWTAQRSGILLSSHNTVWIGCPIRTAHRNNHSSQAWTERACSTVPLDDLPALHGHSKCVDHL